MRIDEPGRNDPCPCGSGKKYKKCCAESAAPIATPSSSASKPVPVNFVKSLNEAMRQLESGDIQSALNISTRLLESMPDHEDALYMKGLTISRMGGYVDAEALLTRAVQQNNQNPRNYIALAEVYHRMGRFTEVRAILQQGLNARPADATLNCWYGAALMLNGDPEGAILYFQKAIAGSLTPQTEAMEQLYAALMKTGAEEEAAKLLSTLKQHKPNTTVDVTALFMFPEIADSREEITRIRKRIAAQAEALLRAPRQLSNLETPFQIPPFFLAFQGENDRDLLALCAKALRACSPELNFIAPHCLNHQGALGRKPRIGFISQYFHTHSVGLYFNRLIAALQETGQVDVSAYSLGGVQDSVAHALFAQCPVTMLPSSLAAARTTIARAELDVLVYTDICMNNASYFLAFSRLAPVQCVMPGHPDTTGIDTVDIYLTSAPLEPEGAEAHYTEKPLILPHFVAWGDRPAAPKKTYTRADFSLNDGEHLYFCPMTLQKLHPDFDLALKAILAGDVKARIVLVKDLGGPHRLSRLQARLTKNLGDAYSRVTFLSWMNADELAAVVGFSNVILDPFPFGGGTTFYQTCAIGTPFVTLPTTYMRGRVGLGFTTLLNMPELVATDADDYAAKAIRIASDAAYRSALRERMLASNDPLYGDTGATKALAEALANLAQPAQMQAGAA